MRDSVISKWPHEQMIHIHGVIIRLAKLSRRADLTLGLRGSIIDAGLTECCKPVKADRLPALANRRKGTDNDLPLDSPTPMDGHLSQNEPHADATHDVGRPRVDARQGEPIFGSAGAAPRWIPRAGDPDDGRQPL